MKNDMSHKSKTWTAHSLEKYVCEWDASPPSMMSSMTSSNGGESWDDLYSCCASSFDSSSSSSISSLWGRTNTSPSESSCKSFIGCRHRRPQLGVSLWSSKRGLDGTHIRPASPWATWRLQCSSKRCASASLIFDGSFHSKPSGVHSLSIQDDGSRDSKPHGIIVFLFPVV